MEKFLNKRYKVKSSENFDEYLEYLDIWESAKMKFEDSITFRYKYNYTGVSLIVRKILTNLPCECTLSLDADGSYTITAITPFKSFKVTFKPGVEFQSMRLDGEKVRAVMQIEGNKLIETQTAANGLKGYHVTEYTEDYIYTTVKIDGWDGTCMRIYEIVK